MHERFSDHARVALELAASEARRLNHEYLGTEHLLLGIVKLRAGKATEAFKLIGVSPDSIQAEIERVFLPGPLIVQKRRWIFWRAETPPLLETPRARKVIEYAMEKSQAWGHSYVGTEHILLGLLHDQDGITTAILANLGVDYGGMRRDMMRSVQGKDEDA